MATRQEELSGSRTLPRDLDAERAVLGSILLDSQMCDEVALVLRTDGTIDILAPDRTVVQSWKPGDPEWGGHAFRFGIRVQERTVAPRGPDTGSDKPGA